MICMSSSSVRSVTVKFPGTSGSKRERLFVTAALSSDASRHFKIRRMDLRSPETNLLDNWIIPPSNFVMVHRFPLSMIVIFELSAATNPYRAQTLSSGIRTDFLRFLLGIGSFSEAFHNRPLFAVKTRQYIFQAKKSPLK